MKKYKYKEVKALGFKRWEGSDSIFFDKYGFKYFGMDLKLRNKLSLSWDITEHTINLYKNGDLVKENLSHEEVELFIKIFKK
jgi:hypothetical protein